MRFISFMILMLICVKSNAQETFLDTDRAVITATMNKREMKLEMSDKTTDGQLVFDGYRMNDHRTLFFYFDKTDFCTLVVDTMPMRFMIPAIKNLNDKFIKVDQDSWVNQKHTISITLKTGDSGFSLYFHKI